MSTIVVVDQDASNRHLLGEVAAACGWDLAGCARNVEEGLALLARTRPDCLITDYRFDDGATGADLVARARALLPGIHTVIFTGWDLREVALAARACPPDRMLRKPGTAQALIDLLAGLPGGERHERRQAAS